jgi:hypothetical protein
MADAIENLAQDLSQANPSANQGKMYLVGDQYLPFGALVPNTAGVRVGDVYPNALGDNWNWDKNDWDYAPSTLGTGEGIDFNVRDKPVERINIKSGDEQDAFIRTGIGTPLDPKTEEIYGVKGLVPPDQAGGFVGVNYLTPKQIEDLTAGQTPSVPQGVVTRGEPVSIPGKGLPNYRQIINDDGSISYLNEDTRKIDFTVPGVKDSTGVADLSGNPNLKLPSTLTKGTGTSVTPSPVESYQSVGADEPTTTSAGGFDNTGGNVTAGPGVAGPSVDDTIRFNPDYKPKPEVKPGDEFKDSPWSVFDPTGKDDKLAPYTSPSGEVFPTDQNGYKWNYQTQQFDCVGGKCSEKEPVKDTGTTPAPPAGGGGTGTGGTTTTPPGGGTTTTPPGGGVRPGTGTGTYTGTPLPPREPVTPLVRKETVIPTKGTKEVPLPDRQADPFAKLYADLLANSQQQQDQYRYINYDPDQIMNAAMSGFRRRGAMRSLQGY